MFDSLSLVDAILLSSKQDILSHVHVHVQLGFDEPLGKHKCWGRGRGKGDSAVPLADGNQLL